MLLKICLIYFPAVFFYFPSTICEKKPTANASLLQVKKIATTKMAWEKTESTVRYSNHKLKNWDVELNIVTNSTIRNTCSTTKEHEKNC